MGQGNYRMGARNPLLRMAQSVVVWAVVMNEWVVEEVVLSLQ
jgi:hypothetical protein